MISSKEDFLQIFLVALAVILSSLATLRLLRTKKFNPKAKRLNLVFTWLIPYIWALLVLSFSDKPPKKTGKFDNGRYMDTGYPGA